MTYRDDEIWIRRLDDETVELHVPAEDRYMRTLLDGVAAEMERVGDACERDGRYVVPVRLRYEPLTPTVPTP